MKRIILITLISIVSLIGAQAQSLGSTVTANSGATLTNASNTLSFTLGEAVIGTLTNGNTLGQGFWLGAANTVILSSNDFDLGTVTTVYPNPANNNLHVAFENLDGEELQLSLLDIQGRKVLEQSSNGMETETLSIHHLASGTYLLSILQKGTQQTKIFKIIKQ